MTRCYYPQTASQSIGPLSSAASTSRQHMHAPIGRTSAFRGGGRGRCRLLRTPQATSSTPPPSPPKNDKNTPPSSTSSSRTPSMVAERWRPPTKEDADLRAEAEAPFRSVRLVLFGFGAISAALATFLSIPTLIGALAGAVNAKPLLEAGQDLGINVGALLFCGTLVARDLEARDKQMTRLLREDALGSCQLELSNGRTLRLAQLRGAARPVIVAGSPSQVAAALEAAELYREALVQRGVFVVGIPIYEEEEEGGGRETEGSLGPSLAAVPPLQHPEDLRWRGRPIRKDDWKKWFNDQAAAASKATVKGLYVGLRKDGRVRASGQGIPPWAQFAAQLPPEDSSFWGGFFDGMDGSVRMD